MLITENAAEVSRKIRKKMLASAQSPLLQLVGFLIMFMQLCIKLIIMEESTKKIFKPKVLVQE
jgi:hypothetical protein